MAEDHSPQARPGRPAAASRVRRALAGFFPVGIFAIVLTLAIGAWGLVAGIVGGVILGAAAAWLLVRIIARNEAAQWIAAVIVAALIALYALSFI